MIVTFFCGIIFTRITLYMMTDKTIGFFQLLLDSMIPTIATYSLCEILHNLSVIQKSRAQKNICTLVAIVALAIQLLSVCNYYVGKTTGSIILVLVATVVLLVMVGLSYREGYCASHRNHALV